MYDIFKKHIIRNEKHLLPIINKSKRFRIDDKCIDTNVKTFDPDKFCLPNYITYLEFKNFIIIAIDQYHNQIGHNKNRKLILVSRIKKHSVIDEELPTFIPSVSDMDDPALLEGNIILPRLLGFYEEDYNGEFSDEEVHKLRQFCFLNNTYLKWGFSTDDSNKKSIPDDIFYVFSKKTSLKLKVGDFRVSYWEKYLTSVTGQILITLYKSVTYHNFKLKQLETGGQE